MSVTAEERLARLRVKAPEDPDALPQQPPNRTRRRPRFTKFPETWAHPLLEAGAGGALMRLSLVLLQRSAWANPVVVSNGLCSEARVDRRRKRELLSELEQLGLAELEWRYKKSPIARVLKRAHHVS